MPRETQRLIHLFRIVQRHVEVLIAAHKECWGHNPIRVQEGIRHSQPAIEILPWQAQFLDILPDVHISAEAGERIADRRAAYSRLEARCLAR